ncbi:MAG: metal-dependent transcriptional regulator [Chthonomonadales bacterium]
MADSGKLVSAAVEDYVKAIFKLQQENEKVSTTVLARKLGTSAAAVTKMMKQLAENKLLDYTPYQGVRLTRSGELIALEIIRHHRLIELYLQRALGYSWDEVDAEAEKLEHHISEDFEDRIDRMLDFPTRDPHGDPIPTRDGWMEAHRGTSLATAEPGQRVVLMRVKDSNPEALRLLTQLGLCLNIEMEILDAQPMNGPITLKLGDNVRTIGRELAGHVFIEPCTYPDEEPIIVCS